MKDLYINIKKRREELGITQRELAKACGYKDHTTIAKMEKGHVDISVERLEQIANILDIHPAVLLGGWNKEQ